MPDGAKRSVSGKEPDRGFKEVQQEVCPTDVEFAAHDKCACSYEHNSNARDRDASRPLIVEAQVAAKAEA
jgi:hypothetical protein